jgi:hypothetical protein
VLASLQLKLHSFPPVVGVSVLYLHPRSMYHFSLVMLRDESIIVNHHRVLVATGEEVQTFHVNISSEADREGFRAAPWGEQAEPWGVASRGEQAGEASGEASGEPVRCRWGCPFVCPAVVTRCLSYVLKLEEAVRSCDSPAHDAQGGGGVDGVCAEVYNIMAFVPRYNMMAALEDTYPGLKRPEETLVVTARRGLVAACSG